MKTMEFFPVKITYVQAFGYNFRDCTEPPPAVLLTPTETHGPQEMSDLREPVQLSITLQREAKPGHEAGGERTLHALLSRSPTTSWEAQHGS